MLFRTNAIDDRVRKTLVETLYTQPANLAVGAATGVGASLLTASIAGIPAIWHVAIALSIVAVARVALALLLPRMASRDTHRLELLYEIGAFTYSAQLGLIAAMTIWFEVPDSAQMLIACYAVGYGAGIAARNAGRPVISIGQMVLVFFPMIAALWADDDLAEKGLAVAIVMLWLGMMSITMHVFRTLRDSIAAAETSARLAEKMQHLARTDVVTGLANRAGLNHFLVEHLSRKRSEPRLALFWMDLDKFKEVNDALGHQVGDRVLCEVAQRLRALGKAETLIGRFGGDEFIMACDVKDRREVETIAMAVLAEITRPIRIDDDRLEISCSIGAAILPDDGPDLETLMQGADLALYHAKVNGRNQISFYDPSMSSGPGCGARGCAAARARAGGAWPSSATNFRCSSSRSSIWKPARSAPSNRWSAGSTPKRANCAPTNSSPWPRKPA